LICNFFEDKTFYNSINQSDRKLLEERYSKCYELYKNFQHNNLLDTIIGEGNDKIVFSLKNKNDSVVKFFKTKDAFNHEKENYHFLINSNLQHLVPKMEFFDQHSIVEKVKLKNFKDGLESNSKLLKIESDPGTRNFGILNGRTVLMDLGCIDYNYINENLEFLKTI
jgi:hypothetical protein